MSEQLERWKAREKIRSDVGWVAVYVGLLGALSLWLGVSLALGGEGSFSPFGVELPPPWNAWIASAFGALLLLCAVGLWNARLWARRLALVLFGLALVDGPVSAIALFGFVYLFRPDTVQRFQRTNGRPPSEPELRPASRA